MVVVSLFQSPISFPLSIQNPEIDQLFFSRLLMTGNQLFYSFLVSFKDKVTLAFLSPLTLWAIGDPEIRLTTVLLLLPWVKEPFRDGLITPFLFFFSE